MRSSLMYFGYATLLVGGVGMIGCGSVSDEQCGVAECGDPTTPPNPTPPSTTAPPPSSPPPAPTPTPLQCSLAKASFDRAPTTAELLAPIASHALSVALDENNVFYSTAESDSVGAVYVVPKAGGAPKKIADMFAYDLAVSGTRVIAGGSGRGVRAIAKDGSSETPLVGKDAFDFAVDGAGYLYWSDLRHGIFRTSPDGSETVELAQGFSAQGVAVHDAYVFWADYAQGRIHRTPIVGGTTELVYDSEGFVRSVAFDCTRAFISLGNYGEATVALDASTKDATNKAPFANVGGSMALDSLSLYVVNGEAATRVSLATGEATRIGNGPQSRGFNGRIAVDDNAVYWTSNEGIMRAAK